MSETNDPLFNRLRDTVLRLAQAPQRAVQPVVEDRTSERDAVRKLARSRVSQILRQLRATHGLSYAQIQEQTGLSQQLLFDIEYKERRLTLEELRILARCYGVSASDVLGVEVDNG